MQDMFRQVLCSKLPALWSKAPVDGRSKPGTRISKQI